jgi:hypothetical protein
MTGEVMDMNMKRWLWRMMVAGCLVVIAATLTAWALGGVYVRHEDPPYPSAGTKPYEAVEVGFGSALWVSWWVGTRATPTDRTAPPLPPRWLAGRCEKPPLAPVFWGIPYRPRPDWLGFGIFHDVDAILYDDLPAPDDRWIGHWWESRSITAPAWAILTLAAIIPVWAVWQWWRRRHVPGHCPDCRYDLRAHQPGQRCPECGREILLCDLKDAALRNVVNNPQGGA